MGFQSELVLILGFLPLLLRALSFVQHSIPDELIWQPEPSGQFTVKSAYHLAFSLHRTPPKKAGVDIVDCGMWKWLWIRKVPPKLKFFMWQCLHRILPTREALALRGMDIIPICPVCGKKEETLEHLFFLCSVARRLWRKIGFNDHLRSW
ncbi:unnamed protein product, partial [Linum tenue]